jgi:hypothetical protein
MRFAALSAILFGMFALSRTSAEEPTFSFPQIEGYGGVVEQSQVAEGPRKGAKVVFDITADSKPDEVNRGLESVARYLNLNAQAGNAARDMKLALVLHGGATKCALSASATVDGAALDVGHSDFVAQAEFKLSAPALNTTMAPDTRTFTHSIRALSTASAVETMIAGISWSSWNE